MVFYGLKITLTDFNSCLSQGRYSDLISGHNVIKGSGRPKHLISHNSLDIL
jgi:hypothetical protein